MYLVLKKRLTKTFNNQDVTLVKKKFTIGPFTRYAPVKSSQLQPLALVAAGARNALFFYFFKARFF